jgi:hypothetical protein
VRYEHLIEINNPLLPLLDPLDRDDLWQGLVQRAYAPQRFILGLEDARVDTASSDGSTTVLNRILDYGAFKVEDTVTLRHGEAMITEVTGQDGSFQARLIITIEEPAPARLYLRFLYELAQDEAVDGLSAVTTELRQRAYYAADMDTVARIRELAAKRRLQ